MNKDTPAKAVGTHAYIQQVTRRKGISASTKVVLTYCLEKYQATDQQGNPWNFSNASIRAGTGIPERTVRRIMSDLHKAKVLKHYGTLTIKTRPMHVYLFNLPALNAYLNTPEAATLTLEKDTAKAATLTLVNDSKGATHVEASPKTRDTAKDTAKLTDHKEEYQKKEEEKVLMLSTVKPIEVLTGHPSTAGAPSSTPKDLAEQFEAFFSGHPSTAGAPQTSTNLGEVFESVVNGGPVLASMPPSVQDAPVAQQNTGNGAGLAPSRGLMTCPVPLYGIHNPR